MLRLSDVHSGYGRTAVLQGVSLTVDPGQVLAVCGPNGAGKSTLLRTVAQQIKVDRGSIEWEGVSLKRASPSRTVRMGIALCPEGRRVFPQMTTLENLRIGAYTRTDSSGVEQDIEEFLEAWPVVARRTHSHAGLLSGGEQQIVAIGRALMSRPRLLLLDEPSLGLAPVLIDQVYEGLRALVAARHLSVLLVEQNVAKAMELSHRIAVLAHGSIGFESDVAATTKDEVGHHYFATGAAS